ncbi:MAG: hypothetical protein M3Y77_00050 [Actinomycetota bacterium]|nr:hypothetical protein [Actinomycetota bacterium]
MPRRNRVDPWGDLHATAERGLFTGNRGCVVDDAENVVRHHRGNLWIICRLRFRDWRVPLARPNRWTPLFFLDDVAALAAGHRPCGLCRREDYVAYRDAVTDMDGATQPVGATALNRRLAAERLRRGRGLARSADRKLSEAAVESLPTGTVYVAADGPRALLPDAAFAFGFGGWHSPIARPTGLVRVLTPPTSVAALAGGFQPVWHRSAFPVSTGGEGNGLS